MRHFRDRISPVYWFLYLLEKISFQKSIFIGLVELKYHFSSRSEYFSRSAESLKAPDTVAWINSLDKVTHFIDVGACVGTYGIYFARLNPKAEVVFVEPFWPNYISLLQNIAANAISDRSIPINAALSHQHQTIFIRPSSMKPGSSMHENLAGRMELTPGHQLQKVNCVSFSEIYERTSDAVKIAVKIDVDGPEIDIIDNLISTEASAIITDICVEVTRKSSSVICEKLGRLGYLQYQIDDAKLQNDTGFNLYFRRTNI